ncbi:MAG: hypothetical protein CMG05_04135 [Candidatus Marinimicrobia bacterium]|nr:hypothetical protein [Candidatus Neomarinimicrobiota bacterium]
MIDFHNHVLPNIDDGSKSMEISLDMMRYAAEQGITDVVNTVHYQHPKVETENISYRRIQKELQNLQFELNNNNIPVKLHVGAEVFFLPNLGEIRIDPLATFINGKHMLIEFQVNQIPEIQKQELFDLKMAGVTPIIAHPERYRQVQESIEFVTEWLEAGCIIQVDAGSPLGHFGSPSQLASEKIIKNGWCQILGSDAHNNRKRNFCLRESVDMVRNWIGNRVEPMVYDNPLKVIEGKKIDIDFDYNEHKKQGFFSRIRERIGLS